jgi:protein involved in ribonucleotide reduction
MLAGCSKELNERTVREFMDDADHAFLAGHAGDICNMRSDDFKFTGTTFKLAQGHTVANLEEAVALDNERNAAGDRVSGNVVTLNSRDFCRMANESRELYRRVKLVRTALEVTMSPDHRQATARAHYVLKAPEYAYGDSALSMQDRVEQQTGTIQTETDEESVIALNAEGNLVFMATHAISKEFRVPKERDSRL